VTRDLGLDLGLEGRVAIVTGASRGIGRAVATALAERGVQLVLGARDPLPLETVIDELTTSGANAVGLAVDVCDPASSSLLRDTALERFGRIDIIVNNAGGGGSRLEEFDEDEWLALYRLNVTSAVRLVMACLESMRARGYGRIVNIASTMARHVDPRFGPYGAAKAALVHASRNLSLAYAREGILTNCVLVGLTRTDGVQHRLEQLAHERSTDPDEIARRMMQRQPIAMGRLGEPAEVAAAVVFLCSQQAAWITGADLLVDGGTITDL